MSFRDKVGNAWDTSAEDVDVAGVKVQVRSMSVADKARLLKGAAKDGQVDAEKWYPWVVLTCCYDPETGEKAFTEADLDWLGERSNDAIADLAQRCLGVSSMGSDKVVETGKDDS